MEELVCFINQREAPKYDLLKMALAHYGFCWVHLFGNGNGRVIRLLSYAILIKAGFDVKAGWRVLNPTAVFCNNRNLYYEHLAEADTGTDEGLAVTLVGSHSVTDLVRVSGHLQVEVEVVLIPTAPEHDEDIFELVFHRLLELWTDQVQAVDDWFRAAEIRLFVNALQRFVYDRTAAIAIDLLPMVTEEAELRRVRFSRNDGARNASKLYPQVYRQIGGIEVVSVGARWSNKKPAKL